MEERVVDVSKLGSQGSGEARGFLRNSDRKLRAFLIGVGLIAVAGIVLSRFVG